MGRSSKFLCVALLALGGCSSPAYRPLDPTAKHAEAGAIAWWYGNDSAAVDVTEQPLAGLFHQKCAVRKLGVEKSAFFLRVATHARRAITSPAFSAMVKARTAFEHSSDSGAQVMDRLRWPEVQINLFMYERDRAHPCQGNEMVDGHTNAFTPMSADGQVHLLFLYEPYLIAAMQLSAIRDVARTLVHESLHAMGYSHAGLEVGDAAYNNTVPLYIACLVENWGGKVHQAWIEENCHKADAARTKPPG